MVLILLGGAGLSRRLEDFLCLALRFGSFPRSAVPFLHSSIRCFSACFPSLGPVWQSFAHSSPGNSLPLRRSDSLRIAFPSRHHSPPSIPIAAHIKVIIACSTHCSSLPLLRTFQPCSSISRHCDSPPLLRNPVHCRCGSGFSGGEE